MAENLKLTLPISIQEVIKIWARQAGNFEKTVPPEIQEIKYMNALMELLGMLAKHHEEMNDSDFIRCFRFFRDSGFAKRLNADTTLAKRASKLESLEPDMVKEPEPPKPCILSLQGGVTGISSPKKEPEPSKPSQGETSGISNSKTDSTSEATNS